MLVATLQVYNANTGEVETIGTIQIINDGTAEGQEDIGHYTALRRVEGRMHKSRVENYLRGNGAWVLLASSIMQIEEETAPWIKREAIELVERELGGKEVS